MDGGKHASVGIKQSWVVSSSSAALDFICRPPAPFPCLSVAFLCCRGWKTGSYISFFLPAGMVPTDKGPSSQGMVFPGVMYGCESWTIRKAEHWRIDAFELWCWRRLLRVPWSARRSNQCILKEISPEYSLEGLMLKLKLQYFGHLMWRAEDSDAGKDWRQEKGTTEDEMVGWSHWFNGHECE